MLALLIRSCSYRDRSGYGDWFAGCGGPYHSARRRHFALAAAGVVGLASKATRQLNRGQTLWSLIELRWSCGGAYGGPEHILILMHTFSTLYKESWLQSLTCLPFWSSYSYALLYPLLALTWSQSHPWSSQVPKHHPCAKRQLRQHNALENGPHRLEVVLYDFFATESIEIGIMNQSFCPKLTCCSLKGDTNQNTRFC